MMLPAYIIPAQDSSEGRTLLRKLDEGIGPGAIISLTGEQMRIFKEAIIIPPRIRIQVPENVADSGTIGNRSATED